MDLRPNWCDCHFEVDALHPPIKEAAPCCRRVWLKAGRPPIGFCGPHCIRRPQVWQSMQRRKAA